MSKNTKRSSVKTKLSLLQGQDQKKPHTSLLSQIYEGLSRAIVRSHPRYQVHIQWIGTDRWKGALSHPTSDY